MFKRLRCTRESSQSESLKNAGSIQRRENVVATTKIGDSICENNHLGDNNIETN